jgi:hypothetical protein
VSTEEEEEQGQESEEEPEVRVEPQQHRRHEVDDGRGWTKQTNRKKPKKAAKPEVAVAPAKTCAFSCLGFLNRAAHARLADQLARGWYQVSAGTQPGGSAQEHSDAQSGDRVAQHSALPADQRCPEPQATHSVRRDRREGEAQVRRQILALLSVSPGERPPLIPVCVMLSAGSKTMETICA